MSKLTSVEWFYNELIEHKIIKKEKHFSFVKNFATTYELLLEQAKKMHKQEIIDAYATVITKYDGVKSWTKIYDEEAESYYNENYCDNKKINDELKQQKLF